MNLYVRPIKIISFSFQPVGLILHRVKTAEYVPTPTGLVALQDITTLARVVFSGAATIAPTVSIT